MKSILAKIKQWTIIHQSDIILLIGVILISLLSFAMGYIVAKEQEKEPLKILPYELRMQPNYELTLRITNTFYNNS
jgi:hypothetical protein